VLAFNIAQRRAAKAARRKKTLATRAADSPPRSLAMEVRRAAAAPLDRCLLQQGLFENGIGCAVLSRRLGPDRLVLATFLLDVWCLGVKDTYFSELNEQEAEATLQAHDSASPFQDTDPSYLRAMLHQLVAWSREQGIEPQADYQKIEALFGNIRPQPDARFAFGRDGRPVYSPGPTDTPAQIRRRIELLRRRLGDDGFDVETPDVDEGDYDPEVPPEPKSWLEMDETERLALVEAYHANMDEDVPNPTIHAQLHVVIENQIAANDPAAIRRAMARLMADGLDRHDAIHAVATVLIGHLTDVMRSEGQDPSDADSYTAELDQLTADRWRQLYASDDATEGE
jgi:hypothetical protein